MSIKKSSRYQILRRRREQDRLSPGEDDKGGSRPSGGAGSKLAARAVV